MGLFGKKEEFNRKNEYGLRKLNRSIMNSLSGLRQSYGDEQSLWLHFIMSIVVFVSGIIFQINRYDWVLSIILMGLVLCIELLNTAIEAGVDLTTTKIHPLAKRAKDVGSSATFMMSMFAIIGEILIFYPHIIQFFQ